MGQAVTISPAPVPFRSRNLRRDTASATSPRSSSAGPPQHMFLLPLRDAYLTSAARPSREPMDVNGSSLTAK